MSIDRIKFTDQQQLWDTQHARRGADDGLEGDRLVDTPNASAVQLGKLVVRQARIAEVGSANGRDARYWASLDHTVDCMDFSPVALSQLMQRADRQDLADKINPILFDANDGILPDEVGEIDGFYARSALHVDDATLMRLLADVDGRLNDGGVVFIEGKSTNDPKIARSEHIGNGLAVDPHEDGHLRRIWTPELLQDICSTLGWKAIQQSRIDEEWAGTDANFLRLVAKKQ